MNNYEKAKEEGIKFIKEAFVTETPVGAYMDGNPINFISVLSDFAEKIKEGVLEDIDDEEYEQTMKLRSSDSQAIKE